MTFKNLRYGLSSSVVLAASLFSVLSYAATDSIGLTVITTASRMRAVISFITAFYRKIMQNCSKS